MHKATAKSARRLVPGETSSDSREYPPLRRYCTSLPEACRAAGVAAFALWASPATQWAVRVRLHSIPLLLQTHTWRSPRTNLAKRISVTSCSTSLAVRLRLERKNRRIRFTCSLSSTEKPSSSSDDICEPRTKSGAQPHTHPTPLIKTALYVFLRIAPESMCGLPGMCLLQQSLAISAKRGAVSECRLCAQAVPAYHTIRSEIRDLRS